MEEGGGGWTGGGGKWKGIDEIGGGGVKGRGEEGRVDRCRPAHPPGLPLVCFMAARARA